MMLFWMGQFAGFTVTGFSNETLVSRKCYKRVSSPLQAQDRGEVRSGPFARVPAVKGRHRHNWLLISLPSHALANVQIPSAVRLARPIAEAASSMVMPTK